MNLVIIIPSYNSNRSLTQLIEIISRDYDRDIIVVDDGSDEAFVCEYSNVNVIRNIENKGKGFSLRRGFKIAKEEGYTHAITLDADLQHNPDEIGKFINIPENIDFVLGYRERDSSMPIHRKFSNQVTTSIISRLSRETILDSQCGFRRYNLNLISSVSYREEGFQFESEVLIKCISQGSSLEQIKIETIYDKNNKSYIRHVSDTLKFIRLILRSLVRK